jgi:hypothetical protein
MNTKQIPAVLLLLGVLLLPTISFAGNYQYIDTTGSLRSIEATNATIAINTAPSIAYNSGVRLVTSNDTIPYNTPVTNASRNFYQYIDTSGNIRSINASSASIALASASNIATHSGVILVTSQTSLDK